jgi:CDP-glucose 4,6-dehydratase
MGQPDPKFWHGKRVLVTGHTGFKGSWLTLWLSSLGADVAGLALPPDTDPSLFIALGIEKMCRHHIADIRDPDAIAAVMQSFRPEILIHMAAQPLVRYGYEQPIETFATNVIGTANILEACRHVASLRVVVSVTTDKVYESSTSTAGHLETDRLGGDCPYSTSKAAAELVSHCWRTSFLEKLDIRLATARAGNVIGGGDFCRDRIVPDGIRAFVKGEPLIVRNPGAVRPWQLVIEPLAGYLLLAQSLWDDPSFSQAWNFGPLPSQVIDVASVADILCASWGDGASWEAKEQVNAPKESTLLLIDPTKACNLLGWAPRLDAHQAVMLTAKWYKEMLNGSSSVELQKFSLNMISEYISCSPSAIASPVDGSRR